MRIVIAGAGAVGASVALALAERGERSVTVADRGAAVGGSTAKAMGGVRMQFTTAHEVALVRASLPIFEALGAPLFLQVGYLFLATTDAGRATLRRRFETQRALGVAVEWVERAGLGAIAPGVHADDVTGALFGPRDGLADPPAITREWLRRAAALGVTVREHVDALALPRDLLVIAAGARSAEIAARVGVALPIRPLCRQLLETSPIATPIAERLPMVIESESGFHFRRRGDHLVVAAPDERPRWSFTEEVDRSVDADRLARLAHRFPAARGAQIVGGRAGLYDMTPDAHPILGCITDGVFAACGFSGHGFMTAPAVGRAIADEILDRASTLDLAPFRLERFAAGARFDEEIVL